MPGKTARPLLIMGVGQLGRAIIRRAAGTRPIMGTTRNPLRIFELSEFGITPVIMPLPSAEIIESVAQGADVIVTFPPDGSTDAILAPGVRGAARVIYVSTTSVYGKFEGTIDDTTPTDAADENAAKRLSAEKIWQDEGAIIVRAPGLYGPESGLHKSIGSGKFKLPGGGLRNSSRIHVHDLAGVLLAMLECHALSRSVYVIGDLSPCPLKEVVEWLSTRMNVPVPESVPLSEVNHTLRGNRKVDPRALLQELGYSLSYPSYKDGYEALLNPAPESESSGQKIL